MTDIAATIAEYQTRLNAVERQMSDNDLNVDAAVNVANTAQRLGQQAVDVSRHLRATRL